MRELKIILLMFLVTLLIMPPMTISAEEPTSAVQTAIEFQNAYIEVGQTAKIKLFGNKKKAKWKSSSSCVKLVKGKKNYATEIRKKIEEKRIWLRDNELRYYAEAVGEDRDIFELWISKGYIDTRLIDGGKNE